MSAILRACVVSCQALARSSYCRPDQPEPWSGGKRRKRMGISGGAWETIRRKVLARDQRIRYLCDLPGADEVDHL